MRSFEQDASGVSLDFVADDTDAMRKQKNVKHWYVPFFEISLYFKFYFRFFTFCDNLCQIAHRNSLGQESTRSKGDTCNSAFQFWIYLSFPCLLNLIR